MQWICARDMWQQLHYASDVASKLADVTDQASWKQWALEACANGAGRAHRYTKDPSGWCPTVILDAGGGPTARPQAILASVVGEYAAIWEARQWAKSEIVDDVEWRMQHLGRGFPRQPWDPLVLQRAAASYASASVVGYDAIPMQALSVLPTQAAAALDKLFIASEIWGGSANCCCPCFGPSDQEAQRGTARYWCSRSLLSVVGQVAEARLCFVGGLA